MPSSALVTDLVADQPISWRVDAVARRVALGDHPAVTHDHDRLGAALRRPGVLGEGAIEGGFERGVDGSTGSGPAICRQQAGAGVPGRRAVGAGGSPRTTRQPNAPR